MSTDDAERRLRELEEQVKAEQASRTLRGDQRLARVQEKPVGIRTPDVGPERRDRKRPGLLSGWPRKALLIGGIVVAGAVTLWLVGKVVQIALYVGAVAAVGTAIWWYFFRKKKK
jgi:Flp pilus assembly protein TadB